MKRIDIKPLTPEWFAFRRSHITATDVPVIMGVSPYKTPYQLWEEKVYGIDETHIPDHVLDKAREVENKLLDHFPHLFTTINPERNVIGENGLLSATFDGLHMGDTPIECKYISEKAFDTLDHIPEHHFAQLQAQMNVSSGDVGYYLYSDGTRIGKRIYPLDEAYVNQIIEKSIEFWGHIQSGTPPPLTDRDWVDGDQELLLKLNAMITDRKILDKAIEEIKEEAIRSANAPRIRGGGLTIQKQVAKGAIQYKNIDELKGKDLEKYRSPPRVSWVVRILGEE